VSLRSGEMSSGECLGHPAALKLEWTTLPAGRSDPRPHRFVELILQHSFVSLLWRAWGHDTISATRWGLPELEALC
jgi:hypothetical protein